MKTTGPLRRLVVDTLSQANYNAKTNIDSIAYVGVASAFVLCFLHLVELIEENMEEAKKERAKP